MTKQVEIYALTDPDSGETRYIGKANDARKRFKGHLSETRRKTPVYCWIQALRLEGKTPGLTVIEICNADDWQEVEKTSIRIARREGARLLNIAEGGDEPYCSKEVRAANGRKNAKARVDTPFKAYVWKLKRDLSQLIRQGYCDNETREMIRQAARKRPDLFGCFLTLKNRD